MTGTSRSGTELLGELVRGACDTCSKQYDDYYKSFTALDSKAQGAVTLSGVIIGAVIAFVNAKTVPSLLASSCPLAMLLVFIPPVLAVLAASLGLLAMRVIDVTIPFDVDEQLYEIRDLRRVSEQEEEFDGSYVIDFYQARLEHWKEALKDIANSVSRKGSLVVAAQACGLAAMLALLVLFYYSAIGASPCRS